ncbi:MAG: cyclic peptide export ABC transporter [Sheuella sp.]|nr:cyclic peptide export ABC transporter [Sheuella sp.]
MQIQFKSDLVQFFTRESPRELKRLVWLSFFVGVTNTLLIALINKCASDVTDGKSVMWEFFLFCFLLLAFLLITNRANRENIHNSQELIHRFKMRIMHDILRSDLSRLDQIGRGEILQILARDAQQVSQSVAVLVNLAQSAATLICLTLYMATISLVAFALTLGSSVFIFVLGARQLLSVTGKYVDVMDKDIAANALFEDFLNGYKEIKMNSKRALDVTHDIVKMSKDSNTIRQGLLISSTNFFNYLTVMMYVIVGTMIFIVPVFSVGFSQHVTETTTTALFLAASLTGMIQSIPVLSLSNVSAKILRDLESRLSFGMDQFAAKRHDQDFGVVQNITLDHVKYHHPTSHSGRPFVLGPVTYKFELGKVYYIRGNNGSGKTTLMRLLTGLYAPSDGQILVNGTVVQQPVDKSFRDMFAVVFSDFYLFKKMYGLTNYSQDEIDALLKLFKMQGKLSIEHGNFSDLSFSTGQRKRIALLVAILEKRPFIILDEWAADQDPEFRQEFYEHIIPMFREMGKGVIAITHDDQYYDTADHVLYMADGKPIEGV